MIKTTQQPKPVAQQSSMPISQNILNPVYVDPKYKDLSIVCAMREK